MTTSRRHPNIVNLSELPPTEVNHGERFAYRTQWLGRATGATGVGCSWFEIPPGKCAFPKHYHCANEEALFVLEGTGTLQLGEEKHALRAGDYVTFPPGPEHAHLLVNTGEVPLRYLALSTLVRTDVVGYPDSKKLGVMSVKVENGQPRFLVRQLVREGESLDYYDGEE
ncbi:MAG: cupin domain-containing protein [Myxococcales bacterium]